MQHYTKFNPPSLINELDSIIKEFNGFDVLLADMFKDSKYHVISDDIIKYPAIDIKYDNSNVYFIIAATGLDKNDIAVEIEDDILNIKHKVDPKKTENKFKYLKTGICRKAFNLKFKIPTYYDIDSVDVSLKNGELIINFPIKNEVKYNKKIEIN